MEKERLYFSASNLCPVDIETKTGKHLAYLFNLSVGGACFVVPKGDGKLHAKGERLKLAMAPLRAGKMDCYLDVIHAREDNDFHYYGGEFVGLGEEQEQKIAEELKGVKMRRAIKKAPLSGALWLLSATLFFYFLTAS